MEAINITTRPRRYSRIFKAIAFMLVCVALATGLSVLLVEENAGWMIDSNTSGYFSIQDAIQAGDYTQVSSFTRQMWHIQNNLEHIMWLEELRSEYVATEPPELSVATDTVAEAEPTPETVAYDEEGVLIVVEYDESMQTTIMPYDAPDYMLVYEDEEQMKRYSYRGYTGLPAIQLNIDNDLRYLNSISGLIYYAKSDFTDMVYTNVEGATEEWALSQAFSQSSMSGTAAAFDVEYIQNGNERLFTFKSNMRTILTTEVVCLIVLLLSFVYLVYAVGRDSAERTVKLLGIDRLYTEFTLVAAALVVLATLGSTVGIHDISGGTLLLYPIFIPMFAAFGALGLTFVLSLVRRIKHRTILTHSLIYTVGRGIGRTVKSVFNAQSLVRRVVVAVVGLGWFIYLSGFLFYSNEVFAVIGLTSVPLSVWLAIRTLKKLTSVQEDTINAEMSRRLRAERLRTELISNVSHDIRTPLTSVITYVDLLRAENVDNEKARDYIEVIAAKSQRLKVLTDDLFEASKAASGNIPVTIENVNLDELVTQGLGEMDAKIRESGLDFRVNLCQTDDLVSADGRLLWRVIENLLSNVFKYAMPASRVYIETAVGEDYAVFSMKNISAMELNVPADELLERFRRGDEARGGEGSGLGLSIAKSLTEAMGGRFELAIDGDLFKATVTLIKI